MPFRDLPIPFFVPRPDLIGTRAGRRVTRPNHVWCEARPYQRLQRVISTAIDVTRTRVPSSIERWYVLILMCLIYAINIADRYVVSTVLEPIRLDLHLEADRMGMLTSWPLALFYVTCGIPISWFADRSNRRNILSVSLIVWSG